jgi:very-short-patch-repair endonuclease
MWAGSPAPDLLDTVRAALAVCPPGAVVGFHTAAALLGFGVAESATVHVVVRAGSAFPQRRGIIAHQSVLPWGTQVVVRGVPCTRAARTAIDLARTLPCRDALAVLDAALAVGACDNNELAAEVRVQHGLRGVRRAQDLVPVADGRSQCAQESRLRLVLLDGGLDTFEPQLPVQGPDGRMRYVDLGERRARVGAEYDGVSHLDRPRMREDRRRHNALETLGWRMRYFTDDDIYRRPDEVVRVLTAAREMWRRGVTPASRPIAGGGRRTGRRR